MDTGEPIQAPHLNEAPSTPPTSDNSVWKSVREWAQVIIVALIISLPIRFFIAEPFVVNGASMDPTFSTGQFLIVDRVTYRFQEPKRGDVIIFEYPNDPKTYYIKRVIGLPGETVNIKDGKVFVSTGSSTPVELNDSYIAPVHASHDNFNETLGLTQYFVMGDNRAQSSDSRAWGPLDAHFIVGRPIVRLLPINTLSVLPGQHNQ
jgi:signal peptidase I